MTAEETELTFIRCPSCRSLVPSIATRCRMCGHQFEKKTTAGGVESSNAGPGTSGSSKLPNDADPSPSRVRQRTISVSPDEVDSIKRDIARPAAVPPSTVSPSNMSESGRTRPTGEAFRLGGAGGSVSEPPRPGQPRTFAVEDDLSVLETSTKFPIADAEFEDEAFPHSLEEAESEGQADFNHEDMFEAAGADEPDHSSLNDDTASGDEIETIEDDFDRDEEDEGEEDQEDRTDFHESQSTDDPSASQPFRTEGKRKRRRRRKKKGTQPAIPLQGEGRTELSPADSRKTPGDHHAARNNGERAERHGSQHNRIERPSIGAMTHERESINMTTAPHERKRDEYQQPPRREERHEEPTLLSGRAQESIQAGQMRAQPGADRNTQEGELLGWMVSFQADPRGVATEIRSGRFFVGRQRLRPGDLVLEDPALSTPHCMISATQAEGLFVQDLMSEKGTFVKRRGSEQFVQIHNSIAVEHGDALKFGSHEVLICLLPTSGRTRG